MGEEQEEGREGRTITTEREREGYVSFASYKLKGAYNLFMTEIAYGL